MKLKLPIIRKSIYIQKFNKNNRMLFEELMEKHTYLTDFYGFNFDLFPYATVFFIRGDSWLVKNIIMGFCLIIDCEEMTVIEKYKQSLLSKIDYSSFDVFNGVILHELAVSETFRKKGLGSMLLSNVIGDIGEREILIQAEEAAVGFWRKKGFRDIEGSKFNNMIYLKH